MPGFLQVYIGNLEVRFTYEHRQAELQFGLLFRNWPSSPGWLSEADPPPQSEQPTIFAIDVVRRFGDIPAGYKLIYGEQDSMAPVREGITSVYESAGSHVICFGSDAVVQVPGTKQDGKQQTVVQAQLDREALFSGRLEDIVFCSLAPLLRRRGFFLVHAFAVAKNRRSLLLVGESGSGKTTTGLSLISQGWKYLANDVALLKEDGGNIQVWPTPGGISLTRKSLELLPHLLKRAGADNLFAGKRVFPATELVEGWAAPASATQILFPRVTGEELTSIQRQTRSIALARLMEGSIDRWDVPYLDDHLRLLEMLSRQAKAYELCLGQDSNHLTQALSQGG